MSALNVDYLKGRSRWLRPKVHILDDPFGINPNDGLKFPFYNLVSTFFTRGKFVSQSGVSNVES